MMYDIQQLLLGFHIPNFLKACCNAYQCCHALLTALLHYVEYCAGRNGNNSQIHISGNIQD